MKSIKKLLALVLRSFSVVGICAVIFAVNIVAMRMTPQQVERGKVATKKLMTQVKQQQEQEREQKLEQEREQQHQAGKYFMYEQGTVNGILVDAKDAKANCKTIKAMVEDLGEEPNEIPLPCSADIIKLGFGLLQNTIDIKDLSMKQLVDVANLFNYLDVSADKMKEVLVQIKENIDKNGAKNIHEELKKLDPDLQKVLLINAPIDYLKDCIIKKYAKDRGKPLIGHPRNEAVRAVAISPNGTKIISGCYLSGIEFEKNVILWDISNPNNIIQHTDSKFGWDISSVAFSSEGQYTVVSSYEFGFIYLLDINDINNIKFKDVSNVNIYDFNGRRAINAFREVAFSSDNKKIFSCGNNFIVWDISDQNNITSRRLLTDLSDISVFSPDGKLVASGNNFNDFTIWDVSGQNAISYKLIEPKDFGSIYKLAFSPDGKTLVSLGSKLILWNINDLYNITSHVLIDNTADLGIGKYIIDSASISMIFSHDGNKIALGHAEFIFLLDIKDLHNVIRIDTFEMNVRSMAFTPDDKQLLIGGHPLGLFGGKNLILWTLITDQEATLINQIKNYTVDQVRLIYQLCLQSKNGQVIELKKDSEEYAIFMTLPKDMQKLLTDLFFPKGWLSGWWS